MLNLRALVPAQVYSLQVTPMGAGLFVGVLNVLEWGKLAIDGPEPPFAHDVMRVYLATSRDGVHFDAEWVYAQQELIPHGECRRQPGCANNDELTRAVPEAFLLCCPFDHGIVLPASNMLTVGGEHLLHYEGRQAWRIYEPNSDLAALSKQEPNPDSEL
jgi:hypothetical protein